METKYRTGQERFYERYPCYPKIEEEYLGVGAIMINPSNLIKSITMGVKNE